MIDLEAQQLREDYLSRLDAAIADLPWRVANELRSGIAEELDGLDAAAVRARIAQLGDPAQIAAAAGEESGSTPPAPVVVVAQAPVAKPPAVDAKWFAIVGALALGFGSLLFPVGGWIIGIGLVTSSRFWRRWEKAVAILLPFGVWALVYAASAVAKLIWVTTPDDGGASNPLLPASYDLARSGFIIALVLIPVGALWLLWRLRGRDAPLR
ncbi:HAAS signaling domain-containing protein [Microbacterium sp. 22242]|uniref:HAAS signaling domain-containing protein n=1 Tax=Microbacterium sp. 22242 TaxID=3453896 RepID=UPI003F8291E8